MTRNVFDSLLEVAERLLEKPPARPAEPPPAAEPAGLDGLPDQVRAAVRPFLERFTITNITYLPADTPEPDPSYGRGERGHQAWRLRNLAAQAAEYYRVRDSGAQPVEASEPKHCAVAWTPAGRVEIRKDGASRWVLFTGQPPARVPHFATPWYDHARREAEARFGRPEGGWRFD